jgi:DNA invertase Pin-like site-specific DNA recombinase
MGTTVLCGAYARSSDDKQEASCPQQKQWAEQKAAALGMELAFFHQDVGVPGDVLDRPGLNAVFADLERHLKAGRPVTVLLAFDQDRVSRATSWATGAVMERLTKFGVGRLVTASKDIDLYDDTTRAIFDLEQNLGKRAYVKAMSRNVARGMAKLASDGWWTGGPAPLGYRIAGGRHSRRLVPGPPEEVEAVRELFRLAAEGVLTLPDLARLANERGWPVPAASTRHQRRLGVAPCWTVYTVRHVVHQPAYVGLIRYGKKRTGKYHQAVEGEPVECRGPCRQKAPPLLREGRHEPIVDRATFDRVQAVLAARQVARGAGRPRPNAYAFAGRIVCDGCGKVMHGRSKPGFHGYVCGTWREGRGCARNSVREDVLLERVAELLARELGTRATLRALRKRLESQRTGRGETLKLAVQRGRDRAAELERQLADAGARLLCVSPDMVGIVEKEIRRVRADVDATRQELAGLEQQAARATADDRGIDELLDRLAALPDVLRKADAAKRNRVVRLAVASMRLRFDARDTPSGRRMTKWTGGTVTLRGDGPSYDIPLGGREACRWPGP